jgi:hypothetical protein
VVEDALAKILLDREAMRRGKIDAGLPLGSVVDDVLAA